MLNQAIFTILTAALQKVIPILIGIFIMRTFGSENYQKYSYLLVFLSLLTTLISAGMVPALIRRVASTTQIIKRREHVHSFLISACFLWIISTIIALLLSRANFLPPFLQGNYAIFFLICFSVVGLLITSIGISLLQSIGDTYKALNLSVIYSTYILAVTLISWRNLNYAKFILLYLFGYIVTAFFTLMILKKSNLLVISEIKKLNFLSSLKGTLGETISIFLPNSLWMVGVFLFHSFLINTTKTKDYYVWFSMGYQWLTFIIFIPSVIAPLVIPLLLRSKNPFTTALKLSLFYLTSALAFSCLMIYFDIILNFFYQIELSKNSRIIILYVLIGGSFAAGNAPLLQYLFSVNKSLHILYAALAWVSISIMPRLIDNLTDYCNEIFLMSYLISYIVLLISSYIVSKPIIKRL